MTVYMVERSLPGITMEQLGAAQKAAIDTSAKFTEEGTPVRYIRTTFVPGSSACMCLFEGNSANDVRAVNDEANIPSQAVFAPEITIWPGQL